MATHKTRPIPRRALEVVRAFGGHTVVVTPALAVVYLSPDAAALPIVTKNKLTHPQLAALATEAWRTRTKHPVVQLQRFDDLGPIEQAEVAACKLVGRCVLVTITDMTAARRIEEVRHDLISNIGHELRTPVAAVQVIADALDVARDDPAAVARFSERLKVEARRMGNLIEDILALARAQTPDPARFVAVDLVEVAAEAVRHQTTHAETEGITVALVTPKAVRPLPVTGDADALVTATENLIDNAVNYSAGGSTVTVTVADDKAGHGVIKVADRGIGIETADQGRIFERFFRSDRARSRRTGGTGLGLAIVKNVALGHGGTVSVRSTPGKGSTFTIELPLADDAARRAKETSS